MSAEHHALQGRNNLVQYHLDQMGVLRVGLRFRRAMLVEGSLLGSQLIHLRNLLAQSPEDLQ